MEDKRLKGLLSFSETKRKNAVEQLFCLPYGKLRRMETDEMKALDEAIRESAFKVFRDLDKNKAELRSQIIQRYTNFCTVRLDSATRVYIAAVSRNFEEACMLLAFTQFKGVFTGNVEMNYFEFSRLVCPDGHPREEDLKDLWKSLKVNVPGVSGSDNLMDYPNAFDSIQF